MIVDSIEGSIRFCPECGVKLAGPRKLCPKCGQMWTQDKMLSSSAPAVVPQQDKYDTVRTAQSTLASSGLSKRDDDKTKSTIVILLIVAFAVIFIVAMMPFETTCDTCGGDGVISSDMYSDYGDYHYEMECPVCGGDGTTSGSLWFIWLFLPLTIVFIGVYAFMAYANQ